MSTATAFRYPQLFPFCVEHKTASEIAAIDDGKVTGTLEEIMAYFWLLETVDFTFLGNTQTSFPFCHEPGIIENDGALNPVDRICEDAPDVLGLEAEIAQGGFYNAGVANQPFIDSGEPGYPVLKFKQIVYDTTNDQYVLICEFYILAGIGGVPYSTRAASVSFGGPGTAQANSETVTIFGQSQTAYRWEFDASPGYCASLPMSVSAPAYFTIV